MEPTIVNEFSESAIVAWLERCELREAITSFHVSCERIRAIQNDSSFLDVVLCTRSPEQWMGSVFACIVTGQRVWFTSPLWRDAEWKQVASVVRPHLVLGEDAPDGLIAGETSEAPRSREPGLMIPTGGSAGRIKFAWHTPETMTCAAIGMSRFFFGRTMRRGDFSSRCELPLWHISGWMQVVRAFLSDSFWSYASSVIDDTGFIPHKKQGTYWLSLVPTQLARMLISGSIDVLRKADFIVIGGGACPEHWLREAIRQELPLWVTYGMTETCAMIAGKDIRTADDLEAGAEVFPHCSISIRPIAGRLDENGFGEVCVRSESMCKGYNGVPFEGGDSQEFATGDIGYLDSADRLHVKGRIDSILNTGGEKVFPFEVQSVIGSFPGVSDCRVFGIDDAEWGSKVACVYTTEDNRPIDADSLKRFVLARLSPYKVPKVWRQVRSIPYDAKGKIHTASLTRLVTDGVEKS